MKHLRLSLVAIAILFTCSKLVSQEAVVSEPVASPYAHWENEIADLEALDQTLKPNQDAILFVGSSSIRLWDTIAEDMAPFRVIKRGFGGSKYDDLAFYAKRLIQPHVYRAMVVFVANDVTGNPEDHSAEEVDRWARQVIAVSREHRPEAAVFLIEVTPNEKRFAVWEQARAVNAQLREISLTTPNTYFISTAEHFLTADDQPRSELFRDDQLHLNRAGYDVWGSLIRRRLEEVFRQSKD